MDYAQLQHPIIKVPGRIRPAILPDAKGQRSLVSSLKPFEVLYGLLLLQKSAVPQRILNLKSPQTTSATLPRLVEVQQVTVMSRRLSRKASHHDSTP